MQLPESHMDRQSLEQFGQEAASLLLDGNFRAMAERFGYALAYRREPAGAMEEDLVAGLSSATIYTVNLDVNQAFCIHTANPPCRIILE
jgi:hypothetical protein